MWKILTPLKYQKLSYIITVELRTNRIITLGNSAPQIISNQSQRNQIIIKDNTNKKPFESKESSEKSDISMDTAMKI